ncbi:MAG TPA: pantetheine-phosphate adenylyltransferase [bacterium]
MKKAIYAGTFDPITYGHMDIVKRASRIFDRVIIGVSARPKKTLFSQAERIALVKAALYDKKNIEIAGFSTLLIEFAHRIKATTIIRGIRAVSDFDNEFQMALMNRKLDPGIETVFLMTSEKYIFISSSLVKEIAALGGDISSLVPPVVAKTLLKKLKH